MKLFSAKSKARQASYVPGIENLEDRLVMSTLLVNGNGLLTYTAGSGVANGLTISLDQATDTYRISDVEVINAPGFLGNGTTSVSIPNARVSSMRILLGDGADTLTVAATKDAIQVEGGSGNDSVVLVNTGGTLDTIQGSISFLGNDDVDTLTINDQGAATGKNYGVTSSAVTRNGTVIVANYGTLETINLNTTGLSDTVKVTSTAANTAINVRTGFGNDTLTVGGTTGGLSGIQGRIVFNGQEGSDTVAVDDTLGAAGRTFDVTAVRIVSTAGPSQVNIRYTSENVVVSGGAFGDVINLESTLAGTTTTFNTGAGSDAVNILNSPTASTLDPIRGVLRVNGQDGTGDVLNINDTGTILGQAYTITATSVLRSGAARISYGSVENVTLSTGNFGDGFNVLSTAAGTALTIRANGGADTARIGTNPALPALPTLNGILGTVTFDGGSGVSNLSLQDQGSAVGQTYTITSTSVSRPGIAQVNYSFPGTGTVALNTGAADDVVNVRSTTSGSAVAVNLGNGNDTVNVGFFSILTGNTLSRMEGTLTVNGQGGRDVLNVNDQQASLLQDLQPVDFQLIGQRAGQTTTKATTPAGQVYRVGPSSVTRDGIATINYDTEAVVLNTTQGDDTITVNLPKLVATVTVNAGNGADDINLSKELPFPVPVIPTNPRVILNGQDGSDTLAYVGFKTGVRVNLGQGTASNTSGIIGIENVRGGDGNDILIGDSGANTLRGGSGRDLLIGGGASDQLFGGIGGLVEVLAGDATEDILIGNGTTLDTNPAALSAIMAEWGRTDQSYSQRIQHLKLGGGLNGAVRLDLTKLVEDNRQDTLTGGSRGLDWFFLTGTDTATDLNRPGTEQVN